MSGVDPKMRIAIPGERGSYSHLACRACYSQFDLVCCPTVEGAIGAVEEGTAHLAVIPIENSRAGRVTDIHHLLPRSPLYIIREHFQPIHHQLLALPGTPIDRLRTVRSHVQALAQSQRTLRELGLQPIGYPDTASAARDTAAGGDSTVAAIGSTLSAEIYGLDVLRRDIEDAPNNTTRFVVMSLTPSVIPEDAGEAICSVIFRVRNIPAVLYKALGGFATNGVNLIKIESYQQGDSFAVTHFYIEFAGHPDDPAVALALGELRHFSRELRLIGTFPRHPFRDLMVTE